MESDTFVYFAYGSNMLTERLRAKERAPSAKILCSGVVSGRRLTFDKVSTDGSGKCDAEHTGNSSDRVYGVVFEIESSERSALDRAEGCGSGYECKEIEIETETGPIEALTYLATRKEAVLKPYRWYKALVVAGAVENKLPDEYVEWLRTVECIEDPNHKRRAKNEKTPFGS